MTQKKETKQSEWVAHRDVMMREFADADFRYHYEQRRMVHEIALVVRGLRKCAGLTQTQLAEKIGVKQPMIARIERGIGHSKPSWPTLHRIVIALGAQLKFSFSSQAAEQPEPLVEIDGKPPKEIDYSDEARA